MAVGKVASGVVANSRSLALDAVLLPVPASLPFVRLGSRQQEKKGDVDAPATAMAWNTALTSTGLPHSFEIKFSIL